MFVLEYCHGLSMLHWNFSIDRILCARKSHLSEYLCWKIPTDWEWCDDISYCLTSDPKGRKSYLVDSDDDTVPSSIGRPSDDHSDGSESVDSDSRLSEEFKLVLTNEVTVIILLTAPFPTAVIFPFLTELIPSVMAFRTASFLTTVIFLTETFLTPMIYILPERFLL